MPQPSESAQLYAEGIKQTTQFLAPRADVPLAIGSLLTILWKYTLMHWYKVDIEKKNFIKDTVWGQAIRRFAELCLVQLAKYRKA
jgi:hypothetical protein